MAVARVVQGQVADHPHAAGMSCAQERAERLVAAEQRVDPVEGGRVVAVRAAGREERRQIDEVGAELCDVVESRLDPGEVAAVQLERRLGPAARRRLAPLAADGPDGRLDVGAAAGEAVGEDLVGDRAGVPVRPARIGREHEVVGVRHVVADRAEPVHPGVADRSAREQPAVARARVAHGEAGAIPGLALVLLVDRGQHRVRLAVHDRAEHDPIDLDPARDAQAHGRRVPELGRPLEDVRVRAVVVGPVEQRRRRAHVGDRHPFTEPCVRPLTMKRCSEHEDDHDRHAGHDHAGRERPPVLGVLLVDVPAQAEREREVLVRLQQRAREDVLVEGADEREDRDHRQDRQRERQDDAPEDLRRRGAVDTGRLVELGRDRVEEALEQPGVDSHHAAEIHEDQARLRVEAHEREHAPAVRSRIR